MSKRNCLNFCSFFDVIDYFVQKECKKEFLVNFYPPEIFLTINIARVKIQLLSLLVVALL